MFHVEHGPKKGQLPSARACADAKRLRGHTRATRAHYARPPLPCALCPGESYARAIRARAHPRYTRARNVTPPAIRINSYGLRGVIFY